MNYLKYYKMTYDKRLYVNMISDYTFKILCQEIVAHNNFSLQLYLQEYKYLQQRFN